MCDPVQELSNAASVVTKPVEELVGGVSKSLASTATSLTSDLAKAIIKAPTDLANAGSTFVKNLANGVNKAASTIVTIEKAIQKNPLPLIETIALTSVGVPFPVANAAVSAMNGGNINKIAMSYATSAVGMEIGSYVGSNSASLLPSDLSAAELANAKAIITSSSSTAATAALNGGNMQTILKAAVVGGVASYTKDALVKQGFNPNTIDTKILNNSITAATKAVLNGQDVGTAVGSAVAVTASTDAVKKAYDAFTKDDATIATLNAKVQSAQNSYYGTVSNMTTDRAALNKYLTDYKSQIGSANINELDGYRTSVNAYNNQMQTAIDNYNRVVADITNNGDDANGTKLQSLVTYANQAQTAKDNIDIVQTKATALESKLGITSYTNKIASDEAYQRQYAQTAQDALDQLSVIAANKELASKDLADKIAAYDHTVNQTTLSEIKPIGEATVNEYKKELADQQAADAKAAAEAKAAADAQAAADAKAHAEQAAAEAAARREAEGRALIKAQQDAQAAAEAKAAADAQAAHDAQVAAEAKAAAERQAAIDKAAADAKAAQDAAAAKAAADAQAAHDAQVAAEAQAAKERQAAIDKANADALAAQQAAEQKAQQEAAAKAQAEAEAKAQAEAQAKAQAEAEAKAQAEAQAKAQADALAKQQAEAAAAEQAKQQAAAEAAAQVKAQQDALAAKQAQEAEAAKVVQPAPPAPEPTPSPLASVTPPAPPAPEQVQDTEMLPSTKADPNTPLPTAADTTTPSNIGNAIKNTLAATVGVGVKAAMTPKPVSPTLVAKPTGALKPFTGALPSTVKKPAVAATVTPPTTTSPISVTKPTGALTSVTSPFATAKPAISSTPATPTGTLKKVASPFAKV